MKKLLWLVLIVLAILVVMGVSGIFYVSTPTPTGEIPRNNVPQAKHSQNLKFSPVSADKIFARIQQLNGERYTESQRNNTRNYIFKELKKLGYDAKLEKFQEGINIIGERKGNDKNSGAILVTAHYDTVARSTGADDNATGVAVALEIARIFANNPTPRTLQLAFFDKEEAGLLGSKAFVKKTARLEQLKGVVNMDMLGFACYTSGCQKYPPGLLVNAPSDKGDFLVVVGDTEHLQLLAAFNQATSADLPPIFALPVPLKGTLIPDSLRSDHATFWLQGIGAVFVTDTANLRNPHYHQPSDTPATIDRNFFTGAAQIVINATTILLESRDS